MLCYANGTHSFNLCSNEILFERTAEAAPNSIKALMNLASLKFSKGDMSMLKRHCTRVLEVDPRYCAAIQLQARGAHDLQKDLTLAERLYNETLNCMLPQRHSSQVLSEVYEALGSIATSRGDHLGSIKYFQLALNLDNDDAGCNYSVALQKLKRYNEAIEPSERCIRAGLQMARLGKKEWVVPGVFLFSANACVRGRLGVRTQ